MSFEIKTAPGKVSDKCIFRNDLLAKYYMQFILFIEIATQGRALFATKNIAKDEVILEEKALLSSQFSWNSSCKYLACEHCMR